MAFQTYSQTTATFYAQYIEQYKEVAILHQQEYGIPASITLAQGLLESGAGRSRLASVANNHFGIKCHKDWEGEGFYQDDDEANECFRHYQSAEESFLDHAKFLKRRRYSSLFDLDVTDYSAWAEGLSRCGYATDPAYPQKLVAIIERYELYQYDSNQPIIAKRRELKGDETIEHSIDMVVMQEVNSMHKILRKWGLHYVKAHKGDSFDGIANEFGISKKKLLKFNDYDNDKAPLNAGDIVYLQEKEKKSIADNATHTVQKGESLHSISQKYGIRLKSLVKINGLDNDEIIAVGESIKLR